jgi:hypothetical protein
MLTLAGKPEFTVIMTEFEARGPEKQEFELEVKTQVIISPLAKEDEE